MDLVGTGLARRRNVAIAIVAIGLLLLASVVALTAIDRKGGNVLDGVDPVVAMHAAPAKLTGKRLGATFTFGTGGALELQVAQTGVFDPSAKRADVAVTGLGPSTLRIIADGPTLYLRTAKPLGGKTWGRLAAADAGSLGSGIGQVSGNQIDALLRALAPVRTATDKGLEKVGKRRVRHLSSTFPASDLAGISPLFGQLGATGSATLDAYLDSDGAPRRITIAAESKGTKVMIGATIDRIGGPGPVEIPPAADVAVVSLRDLAAVLRA